MSNNIASYMTFNKNLPHHAPFAKSIPEPGKVDFTKQYPLSTYWGLYVQLAGSRERFLNYGESIRCLGKFDTVQKFWKIWTHVPQPSLIYNDLQYCFSNDANQRYVDGIMLFREDVNPVWEAAENKYGCHFDYKFKYDRDRCVIVDHIWNSLTLAVVGNTLKYGTYINGIRLLDKYSNRLDKMIRIEVWIKECSTRESAELQDELNELMGLTLDKEPISLPTPNKIGHQ